MSLILGKGTKCERALASLLRRYGIRYRSQAKELLGRPDFLLTDAKVVVFVNGGFWHGRDYDPKRLSDYWQRKILRNMRRDGRVQRALRRLGWSVVNLWEEDVLRRPDYCIARVKRAALHSLPCQTPTKRCLAPPPKPRAGRSRPGKQAAAVGRSG